MHPIERLRYVARASGVEQALLVRETAEALATFRGDPQGLVTACRRVVGRRPAAGAIWWLCSRVLTAADPMVEAWRAADEAEADPTVRELAHALPDEATVCVLGWPQLVGDALVRRGDVEVLAVDVLGEAAGLVPRLVAADGDAVEVPVAGLGAAVADCDLVLLEASAVGPAGFVGVIGSRAAAATARSAGVAVWLVAGVGRVLPPRIWEAVVPRLERDDPWEAPDEVVPLELVDLLVGARGPEHVGDALSRSECPVAPELLREL